MLFIDPSSQGRRHDFESGGPYMSSARLHGGLRALPPVGSRGKAPGLGAKPPEAESFLIFIDF